MRNLFLTLFVSCFTLGFSQVGINTSNPLGTFHIDGGKDNPTTGAASVLQQANDFIVTANGRVGVGTTLPNNTLEVKSGSTTNSGLRLSSLGYQGLLGTDANGDIIAKPAVSNELFFEETNYYYISMTKAVGEYVVYRYNKNNVNDEKKATGIGTQPITLSSVQALTYN